MMSVVVEAVEFACASLSCRLMSTSPAPDVADGIGPRSYLDSYLDLVVIEAVDLPQLLFASRLPVDLLEVRLDLVDALT